MKYAFPLICLLCVACVTTQPATSQADPAEIAKAKSELLDCGLSVLPKVDDGISPANVIAGAIPPLCKAETDKMISLVNQDKTDRYVKEAVIKHAQSGKSFIPVVLQYRSGHLR